LHECRSKEKMLQQFQLTTPVLLALGDVQRQQIIMLLLQNSRMNVNQITEMMSLSRPAVSHHLKILRQSGMVTFEKAGKEKYYFLADIMESLRPVKDLIAYIEEENC
jgi:ArsR family transcriptional regulator, arsenate/arsenite/antimonite-responsive transcriptional repressor